MLPSATAETVTEGYDDVEEDTDARSLALSTYYRNAGAFPAFEIADPDLFVCVNCC